MSRIISQPIRRAPTIEATKASTPKNTVSPSPSAIKEEAFVQTPDSNQPVCQGQMAKESLAIAPVDKIAVSAISRTALRYELLKIAEAVGMMDQNSVTQACEKELKSHVERLDRLQVLAEGQKRF